ncbi:unnamed protein product [Lasius platythorax]
MEDTGILEDFMAKLSTAPDKDTLWMRLSKTVDLHIKNCEETWLEPQDNIRLKGYDIIRNDRIGRRGGGVLIFVRQGIKYSILDNINDGHGNLEVCGVKNRFFKRQRLYSSNTDWGIFRSSLEDRIQEDALKKRTNHCPWWNEECDNLIANRKVALENFKKSGTRDDFLLYKRECAKTRIGYKNIKKENFRKFCESYSQAIVDTIKNQVSSFFPWAPWVCSDPFSFEWL